MKKLLVGAIAFGMIAFTGLFAGAGEGTASADVGTSAQAVRSSPVDCRQDGWQSLRRAEDGTRFASLAECARHVARGGGVTQPVVVLSYLRTEFVFMGRLLCRARVDVSGFAPGTQYTVRVAAADGSALLVPVQFNLTTNASGVGRAESVDLSLSQVELAQATVDGVPSNSLPVLCF